jgi:hypothetical protein
MRDASLSEIQRAVAEARRLRDHARALIEKARELDERIARMEASATIEREKRSGRSEAAMPRV